MKVVFLCRLKKAAALLLIFAFMAAMVSCSPNSQNGDGSKIELSLAHFFPSTHPIEKELVQTWIEEIKKATNGRVVITSYSDEQLGKAADIYKNVVDGVADIGLSCFSYTRGRFQVLEAFELPGIIYKNSKAASKVAWEGIKEINPKEVQDTVLMMVIATGPGDLFTKAPVEKLEDIKDMEIRATGISAQTVELLGGIPVAMAQSEAYEALSKGIVKGNLSPVEVLKGWRHAEVTKYLTKTPFLYNTLFFITMNKDKWNSLPEDIQKAILEVNEKVHEEVGIGLWDKQNEEALKWAVDEQGLKIIELAKEETDRWIKALESIHNDFSKKIKDESVIEKVKALAEKYNKLY
ncbi:MAG TPA: TRAP transporter substrate-binding protein [Clostridiaceae bacterium]|nr:TRAP transporter substrate-binding protein [Clostridiaceae bacterium]